MSTLVGGWVFRESLTTLSDGKSEAVNFSTLGMSGGTEINIYFIAKIMRIEYIKPNNFVDVYQSGTGWVSPSYRFIDFGIEPQEVSDEFYNWFIANAVEQDVKCDILKALEITTRRVRDYSNNKDDELKQEIETWHNYGMVYAGETAEVNEFYYGEVEA